MENRINTKPYSFTNYFYSVFKERVGINLSEDDRAYILSVCNNSNPHRKVDNKGRYSEYFTLRLSDKLITIVCDAISHKIITCVIETHKRDSFNNL